MRQPWHRVAPFVLLLVLVGLYGVWISHVVHRDRPLDFAVYYIAAFTFLEAGGPYELDDAEWSERAQSLGLSHYARHYRYPPLTAQLVAPLTWLSPRVASVLWLSANALLFLLGAVGLAQAVETPHGLNLALGGLLLFVPPLVVLYSGQVTGFLLACLALALVSFQARRPTLLGLSLALAAGLKVTPLALVGYLLWRRQWRALAASLLGLAALVLLQLPFAGWAGMAAYARRFTRLAKPLALESYPANQTLNGFMARLFAENWWGRELWDFPDLALFLTLAGSVVVVVLTVALCWPAGPVRSLFALEFCLVLVALQLVAPFSWYHQLSLLLIPFVVLVAEILAGRLSAWVVVPLGVGFLAIDAHGLLWRHLRGAALALSMPLYATLLLWMILAATLCKRKFGRGAGAPTTERVETAAPSASF